MERRGTFNEFAFRQQLIQSLKNRLEDLVCWFDSFRETHPDIAVAEATRSSEARQAFTHASFARIRQEYDHDACGQTNWWGLAKPCFEKTTPEHQEIINQFLIKRFQDAAHAIRDAGFTEWLNRQIKSVDQQVESAKRILFASTNEDVAKAFHEFRATQDGEMRMDGVAALVSRIIAVMDNPINQDGSVDTQTIPEHNQPTQPTDHSRKGGGQKKRRASAVRGETSTLLIAALTKHHQYDDRSCMNFEPIGCRALANKVNVSPSMVSDFFKVHFGSHQGYKVKCSNGNIVDKLISLNGDVPSYHSLDFDPSTND